LKSNLIQGVLEYLARVGMDWGNERRRPGRPKLLDAGDLAQLKSLVEARPDLNLHQIASLMELRCGKRVALTTWSRALKRCGLAKASIPGAGVRRQRVDSFFRQGQAVHQERVSATARYPSSLTDHEWAALQPLLEGSEKRGRPVRHDRRAMWDAVFYHVRGGIPWRMLPPDLPPYKAVFAFFARARDSGLLGRVYEHLHALWSKGSGCEAPFRKDAQAAISWGQPGSPGSKGKKGAKRRD
jgi:transposase